MTNKKMEHIRDMVIFVAFLLSLLIIAGMIDAKGQCKTVQIKRYNFYEKCVNNPKADPETDECYDYKGYMFVNIKELPCQIQILVNDEGNPSKVFEVESFHVSEDGNNDVYVISRKDTTGIIVNEKLGFVMFAKGKRYSVCRNYITED